MLAGFANGDYEQVEAGSLKEQTSERETQRSRIAWSALWAASLLATFLVGLAAAPHMTSPAQIALPHSTIDDRATEAIVSLAFAKRPPSLYGVYEANFKDAHYIDLTHTISPRTPVWAGFGPMTVKNAEVGADMKGFAKQGEEWSYLKHGFIATAYHLTTDQYGTQLDPPAHWNELGATISDLPPTFALRPLVIIDITPQIAKDAGYHARVEDIEAWEKSHGAVPKGSAVLFRSDWSKKWAEYEEKGATPSTFPGVELDTLKFLHHHREILVHGHEPLDTDMTPSLEGEAWLMHNNFAQIEGVTNLDSVPLFGCLLSIGFAKPLGGAGGYARLVAVCPAGSTTAGTTISESPGAPLPQQPHPLRRNSDGVLVPDKDAEPTKYCSVVGSLGCAKDNQPVWK